MDLDAYVRKYHMGSGRRPRFGNNLWFTFREYHLKVYLRMSHWRVVDGRARNLLEIGSVQVEETNQRQGHFTRFLSACEETALRRGLCGVFIENVMPVFLQQFLCRRGYHECRVQCFVKVFE